MIEERGSEHALRSLMSDAAWRDDEIAAAFSRNVVARLKRRRRMRTLVLAAFGGVGLTVSAISVGGVFRMLAGTADRLALTIPISVEPQLLAYLMLAAGLVVFVAESAFPPARR